MSTTVDGIRSCFEGVIPGVMATCDADGTPNVSSLSHVQYVDAEHIALSYQFFNKTRQNILANPRATLQVVDPQTAAQYRLSLQYLRTETSGPLFESMKAKLAGIASHVGMAGVFRLLGSDVFRVLAVERVPGHSLPTPEPRRNLLAALRHSSERIARCCDLDRLLTEILACLEEHFDITHAMVLIHDAPRARLYTVASRGYEESGVGSEIPLGEGVIGVAARERTPIRIGHATLEYAYSRAIRDHARDGGLAAALATEIPLPGLPEPRSQMAVPIVAGPTLVGVLYVESPQELRFTYDDEDALVALCAQLGMASNILQSAAETADAQPAPAPAAGPARPQNDATEPQGDAILVRHYPENDSVFLGDDYLIKGVAGAIFITLLRDYVDKNRSEFTNRELRLDARIRLPDVSDNLEARLILLSRRLVERGACVRIEKTGRGRFRLRVDRPLALA